MDIIPYLEILCILIFSGTLGWISYKYYQTISRHNSYLQMVKARLASFTQGPVTLKENLSGLKLIGKRRKKHHLLNIENLGIHSVFIFFKRLGPNFSLGNLLIYLILSYGCFFSALYFSNRCNLINAIILGIILGSFAVHQYLVSLMDKRQKIFLQNFPDTLDIILRTIQSGGNVSQAIQHVAQEGSEPLRSIFKQISEQVKLGVPISLAIRDISDRVFIEDFKFFSAVISIQQETGGPLGEILLMINELIRERRAIILRIKTLSAESRMSAMIVSALPPLFMLMMYFISPAHLSLLFSKKAEFWLNLCIILMSVGSFILWRLSNLKI